MSLEKETFNKKKNGKWVVKIIFKTSGTSAMKVESYVFLSKEGKHENISLKVTIHYGVGLFHNGGRDCDSFKLCK